jgi:hypothetical protein
VILADALSAWKGREVRFRMAADKSIGGCAPSALGFSSEEDHAELLVMPVTP